MMERGRAASSSYAAPGKPLPSPAPQTLDMTQGPWPPYQDFNYQAHGMPNPQYPQQYAAYGADPSWYADPSNWDANARAQEYQQQTAIANSYSHEYQPQGPTHAAQSYSSAAASASSSAAAAASSDSAAAASSSSAAAASSSLATAAPCSSTAAARPAPSPEESPGDSGGSSTTRRFQV